MSHPKPLTKTSNHTPHPPKLLTDSEHRIFLQNCLPNTKSSSKTAYWIPNSPAAHRMQNRVIEISDAILLWKYMWCNTTNPMPTRAQAALSATTTIPPSVYICHIRHICQICHSAICCHLLPSASIRHILSSARYCLSEPLDLSKDTLCILSSTQSCCHPSFVTGLLWGLSEGQSSFLSIGSDRNILPIGRSYLLPITWSMIRNTDVTSLMMLCDVSEIVTPRHVGGNMIWYIALSMRISHSG